MSKIETFPSGVRTDLGESTLPVLPLEHRAIKLGGLSLERTVFVPPRLLIADESGHLFYEPTTKVDRDLLEPPAKDEKGRSFVAVTLLASQCCRREIMIADVRFARPGAIPEHTGRFINTGHGNFMKPDQDDDAPERWRAMGGIVYGGQEADEARFNGSFQWRAAAIARADQISRWVESGLPEHAADIVNRPDGGEEDIELGGAGRRLLAQLSRLIYTVRV